MDSPHHTAKLLSEAFAEPILRELHAILSERFADETPSPAGLRAMAAQLVKLPVREQNSGHGHVFPRPDGVRARCGGPVLCAECARDLAQKTANEPAALTTVAPLTRWKP
jgi:hypothetical protein